MINETSTDFAALWRYYKQQDSHGRVAAEVDLSFWEKAAPDYDRTHPVYPNVLAVLDSLIHQDNIVLDVGAGTGRFTLPLAQRARQVTALDHSAAMLKILGRKKKDLVQNNITVLETAWETACVAPHDVVLAAWSLYRQVDILAAMQKLIKTTDQTLIIIESDDDDPQYPHHQLIAEIWEQPPKQTLSKYLLFLGVLWQLGLQADVRVVYETRYVVADSPRQLAQQLGPCQATPTEIDEFTRRLHPLLKYEAARWHYRFTHPIEILTWQRTGGKLDAL